MITVDDVAAHYGLRRDTVRRMIREGRLAAVRINRNYRLGWEAVWACEQGPTPTPARIARYQAPLLSKRRLADAMSVSPRTIERWLADGLPTRNIGNLVRVNPHDTSDWCRGRLNLDLPIDWWR